MFHFREIHTITIAGPPDRVFQAVKEVTPEEIRLLATLFWVRGLPARLAGRRVRSFAAGTPLLQQALGPTGGFVLLAESPGREIVVGTIGQFWKVMGGSTSGLTDPRDFVDFDDASHAKAALNFLIESAPEETSRLRSETRIAAGSPGARRRFAAYWRLIYPGSALLRRLWLKAIKRRAERSAPTAR